MKQTVLSTLGVALALAFATTAQPARAAPPHHHGHAPNLDCKLKFSLTGWSLLYKHAEGRGTVFCENGEAMPVKISAKGGGLTVGKSHIDNGSGRFTDVHGIRDVLGTYAHGDASAGAIKAGTAQVLTKGTVSLALAGAGEGIELGVSVGGFTIRQAGKVRQEHAAN